MSAPVSRALPPAFADFAPFAAQWAVRTMGERHRRRISSSAHEREAFYAAMSPRLDEAVDYLNRFPLHDMPADAATLLELVLALMEVSLTQEVYDAKVEAVHAQSSKRVRIAREMDEL